MPFRSIAREETSEEEEEHLPVKSLGASESRKKRGGEGGSLPFQELYYHRVHGPGRQKDFKMD